MDAFELVRHMKIRRVEILETLPPDLRAEFDYLEQMIQFADELLKKNGPHVDMPVPAPLAHLVPIAPKPSRVPLFQRRHVLKEYLAASGPATRGQILKDTGIPAGTLSALLLERTDFEQTDEGLWAVRQQSGRQAKKRAAGAN